MAHRILIVEDDSTLSVVLRNSLTYEGFVVECAADGQQGLRAARARRPDLLLLDVMMPGLDGFDVCRALNAEAERLPIIMLTARTQQNDKVRGLELGADDYVTKPFVLDELLARIHAVLRRTTSSTRRTVTLGDIVIDFARRRAQQGRRRIELTPREFAVLWQLAEHPGSVVSRDELLRTVWGYHEPPLTRTVDIFIARLRRKIEPDPRHPRFLRTAHGDGYCLVFDP
jgi:two-component system response regulator RegX3